LRTCEILIVKWSRIFLEAEWFRKVHDIIKSFVELWLLNYVIFIDLCCNNVNRFSTISSGFSVYLSAV